MPDVPTIDWSGASGRSYRYYIHRLGTTFNNDAGNYIFARQDDQNEWIPIYAGETENLDERVGSNVANHEKLSCVTSQGGTHIHVKLTDGGSPARLAEEQDIRDCWHLPCNDQ